MNQELDNIRKRKGFALPAVVVFGAIALSIVATGLFVTQLVTRSVFGARLAEEAMAAGRSVVADVHLRLIKGTISDPVVCNDTNPIFTNYDISVPGRITTDVGICRYDCGLNVCRYRVAIEARSSFLVRRKMEAIFDRDTVSGQIKLSEIEELEY